jgi:hypothetical protein
MSNSPKCSGSIPYKKKAKKKNNSVLHRNEGNQVLEISKTQWNPSAGAFIFLVGGQVEIIWDVPLQNFFGFCRKLMLKDSGKKKHEISEGESEKRVGKLRKQMRAGNQVFMLIAPGYKPYRRSKAESTLRQKIDIMAWATLLT